MAREFAPRIWRDVFDACLRGDRFGEGRRAGTLFPMQAITILIQKIMKSGMRTRVLKTRAMYANNKTCNGQRPLQNVQTNMITLQIQLYGIYPFVDKDNFKN